MDCPRDVSARVFRRLVAEMPPAFELIRTRREGQMRYFTFQANWQHRSYGRGDLLDVPVACKFTRRPA